MAEALKRLKVRPESLSSAPQITPMFKKAEGGLKAVLEAMRFASQNETLRIFLKKYDSVPAGDRERLPWEAVAIAAKLDFEQLTGAIMFAMSSVSANTVKIMAWSAHPEVMRKTIKYAKLPSGEKDRSMFHTGTGWLPSAKGPTFIGKQVAVFGSGGKLNGDEPAPQATFGEDDDPELLFPSSSAMQERLVPVRQRLLQDGRVAVAEQLPPEEYEPGE
jgi:hypothetical protein